jgi:hypothetical protein
MASWPLERLLHSSRRRYIIPTLSHILAESKESVVKGLGKSNVTTLLLTVPPYVIGVIAILANAWHADKTGERLLHVSLPPIVSVVAFIIAVTTTAFGPRYL